jgi:FXSXX-COOH protein
MADSQPDPGEDVADARLPELREVRLDDFLQSDNSVLANAVRRVVNELRQDPGNYAAFGNAP